MVRDPPRKSEQACRAVRCSRCQRAQPRRPNKSGTACIERRQRNGRRQRHRLRIHSAQRQRQRRILGHAEPGPAQDRLARLRSRSNRCVCENARLMGHGKTNERRVQVERWDQGIEKIGRECMEEPSQSRKDFDSYLYGNISRKSGVNDGAWFGRGRLACNGLNFWIRYLFDSSKLDYWHRSLFAHAWTHARSCRMQFKVSSKLPVRSVVMLCATLTTPHLMPPVSLQSIPPAESRHHAHRKTRRLHQHQSP